MLSMFTRVNLQQYKALCLNSDTLFRLGLIFISYFVYIFNSVQGHQWSVFLLLTFSLIQIRRQKLALISQLTKLHLCKGFSIGEHKELLE